MFVWALILRYFPVPPSTSTGCCSGASSARWCCGPSFIFAGIALIERFEWVLYIFGGFLLYTAGKLIFSDNEHVDPGKSRFLKVVHRFVPIDRSARRAEAVHTDRRQAAGDAAVRGARCWSRRTDVLFAVDSVPAVLAVSHEQFIVFSSNVFAILGLRSLYFLLADLHGRFSYLQQGLAIILAFVGVKMLIHEWYHIPTWLSLAGDRDRPGGIDRLLAEVGAAQAAAAAESAAATSDADGRRRPPRCTPTAATRGARTALR